MKRSAENILASYIDALHPIIYINHFDFKVIDAAIAHVGQGAKCVEFNNALGLVDFKTKSPMKGCSLEEFLKLTMDDGFEQQTFLILKDVHRELDNPKVIAYLKRIAENNLYNENYSATIFIISEVTVIPRELENYITIFDIPLPTIDEIRGIIRAFITDMEIEVDADTIDEIALSFKGLNEFQIRQILTLAYQDGGCITRGDKALILKEKEQFIKKSGMLEIVNFSESIEDIGGLENLKDWLYRKAFIFRELDKAIKFGVDVPKGIMTSICRAVVRAGLPRQRQVCLRFRWCVWTWDGCWASMWVNPKRICGTRSSFRRPSARVCSGSMKLKKPLPVSAARAAATM